MTLKSSVEVTQGAIPNFGRGFLFVFYINYGAILYHLRDIASYLSKITKCLYPTGI